MRARKKALAASFVVTFAAGCDSKPSQPPAAPTVDVGPAPTPTAGSTAPAPTDSTAAASPSASVAAATLPPAPTVGRVEHNPDGTCTWFPERPIIHGPGKVILNPPPPHQVQCPPPGADGGT